MFLGLHVYSLNLSNMEADALQRVKATADERGKSLVGGVADVALWRQSASND